MDFCTLLENFKMLVQQDYCGLEMWSQTLDYDVFGGYVRYVAQTLEEDIPGLRVLSQRRSDLIEFRTCPPLGFRGYVIKVGQRSTLRN